MDIIILANFCMDFSETDNGRFSYLANMLSKNHDVEIITSDFFHVEKRHRAETPSHPYKITLIHEPGYKRNVSPFRFFSHYIWGRNVERYLKARKKPDVIYSAVPSLTAPEKAAKYCLRNNIRFVIDIQDLWPEAFQMVINAPFLFIPFKKKADRIYAQADAICAVSDTYVKRALEVNGKCKEGKTVYLGTELETFDKYSRKPPIEVKRKEEIWISYCGTLGSSYDLTCVFDALSLLKGKGIEPKFIVMGDGPRKDEFERYAHEKRLNVEFVGRLKYDQMCSLLSICDINVNPIVHLAAQSIINKHADYAASGLPVVSTQENKEYRSLIEQYEMGYNCENNNPADLADKLGLLIEDEELRKRLGKNARRCAEERFDRKVSYRNLCDAITSIQ